MGLTGSIIILILIFTTPGEIMQPRHGSTRTRGIVIDRDRSAPVDTRVDGKRSGPGRSPHTICDQ